MVLLYICNTKYYCHEKANNEINSLADICISSYIELFNRIQGTSQASLG